MQAKENQRQFFDVVKENILNDSNKINRPTKTAIQQSNKGIKNGMNIQNANLQNVQLPAKFNGLQVSKKSIDQTKPVSNVQNIGKSVNALQARPNGQQQTNKVIQAKNGIVDGKIKKIVQKVNSGSKSAMKAKKAIKTNGQKVANKKVSTKAINQQQFKSTECDFVIFCDENDEPVIKAVEKTTEKKSKRSIDENKNEKKKGLAERNVKPAQQNVQVNIKATINSQQQEIKTSVQQLVAQVSATSAQTTFKQQTMTAFQTLKTNTQVKVQSAIPNADEIIKEPVVSIDNLTLDETIETTLDEIIINEQSTIEDKENDPTLMSIDLDKDEEMEMLPHDQSEIFSGDIYCREFSNEIYMYMLKREMKFLPDPTYMSKQPEINSKMRAMLVDWLIDVGIEYKLENETVFLSISYIDRFLSSLTISIQNFQLLGIAALFIASKYEEIYPLELRESIFVTDDAYTKLQMLSMEKVILKSLKFNLSSPTIFYFLEYFLTKLTLPNYVRYFAEYLCFLTLLHTDPFLSYSPSNIAISSIILALHTYTLTDIVDLDEFKQLTKVHLCKDNDGNLSDAKAISIRQSCVNAMYKLHKTAADDPQQAVFTKYSSKKYLSVATVEIADDVPLVEYFFN